MIALFRELEFKTWLEALLQGADGTESPVANQKAEGEVSDAEPDGQAKRRVTTVLDQSTLMTGWASWKRATLFL